MAQKIDNDSLRMIGETLGEVRRKPKNDPSHEKTFGRSTSGFWGKITAQDETNKWRYSWKHLKAKEDKTSEGDQPIFDDEDAEYLSGNVEDENWAVEVNRSKYVLIEDIVWIEPAPEEGYYTFFYNPGTRPALLKNSQKITVRSGNNPGSGNVKIQKVNWNGETPTLAESEIILKVFSNFTQEVRAVGGDMSVQISYCSSCKLWLLSGVDCEAV